MDFRGSVRDAIRVLIENIVFIIIIVIGLVVWNHVWNLAVTDYLSTPFWNSRHGWLGPGVEPGQFNFFGYTIEYQFEGYSDYSFFYVHWGHNIVRGVLPYDSEFGHLILNGIPNNNGVYIFPPLTALLYGLGILIGYDNTGIGWLITMFGFLTVFPVYGIARHLSDNKRCGEIAALTYLLNPMILYYIVYLWLNPAPFIFFTVSGFYLLMRGKKHTGTLSIVTAALLKQIVWVVGLVLVAYLAMRVQSTKTEESEKKGIIDEILQYFDIKGFFTSVVLVVSFVAAIALPFYLFQPNMLVFMGLASGGFALLSYTDPPGYGSPMRLQVLAVVAGQPELAKVLDYLVYNTILLWFGVTIIIIVGVLFQRKTNDRVYFRKLLFVTMILLLWVHLTGPRGVYKYYFTAFAPFFAIFGAPAMFRSNEEKVSASPVMLITPFVFSAMIMIPNRLVYLANVIVIMAVYLIAAFGKLPQRLHFQIRGKSRRTEEEVANTGVGELDTADASGTSQDPDSHVEQTDNFEEKGT